jgi:hypothetical protein
MKKSQDLDKAGGDLDKVSWHCEIKGACFRSAGENMFERKTCRAHSQLQHYDGRRVGGASVSEKHRTKVAEHRVRDA